VKEIEYVYLKRNINMWCTTRENFELRHNYLGWMLVVNDSLLTWVDGRRFVSIRLGMAKVAYFSSFLKMFVDKHYC